MTFLRSFADDLPLQKWLYEMVFPMEAKLTDEAAVTFAKLGIMEYLTSGITSNFDMYLDNRNHARASVELGYRTVFCGSINDFTVRYRGCANSTIRLMPWGIWFLSAWECTPNIRQRERQ